MRRVLFLSLISMGCAAALSANAATYGYLRAPHPYDNTKQSHKQPLFSNIDGTGKLNISIVPVSTSAHEYFSVSEAKHGDSHVSAHIRNHTLYLHQSGSAASHVTIHMNTLNHLSLYGNGDITAKDIHSQGLNLHTNTNGKINLNGMIKVNEIAVSGPSQVTMKWISGNNVVLYSDNHARINIAGNVGTVRAKISGHSFLNAKNLRAHHTWIVTRNYAQAEILSTASLQAYPEGDSNIYYYKNPQLLNSINKSAGNTLQLGWKS